MAEFTIYHNNRCSKSRQALSLLKENGIDFQIRYYLKTPPSVDELKTMVRKLGIKAEELIRKKEVLYKEHYHGKDFSEEEWLEILAKHPRLMQRPIVIKGDRAVIGRPVANVEEFLTA